MSAAADDAGGEAAPIVAFGRLEEPPDFELSYRFDDREDPSEVTVFPADAEEKLATEWITMNAGWVLPLEETR